MKEPVGFVGGLFVFSQFFFEISGYISELALLISFENHGYELYEYCSPL
jgi:hypothetical protein